MSKKQIISTVSIFLIVTVSFFGIKWTKRFFQIDACLDCGGKWNYELKKCENYDINSLNIADFYWHSLFDTLKNKEILHRGKLIDSIRGIPNELIQILNRRELKCKIEYVDLSKDTVFIRIINDEFLTEQMGTDGAHNFLGETVFTLTENDRIKNVRIEMDSGSHASPGIYRREDFKDLVPYP